MTDVLTHLLATDPTTTAIETVEAWWTVHVGLAARWRAPAELALAAGFASDRPAWAFASGYATALAALVPTLDPNARVALAVTEAGGNTPRAIATTVRRDGGDLVLDGAKGFITLGTHVDEMLVLARIADGTRGGTHDLTTDEAALDRPRLALVRVPSDAEGVSLEALPPPPFVPEVPHARATFRAVRLPGGAARLEGDGWSDYVKPFRTVEDLHVHAALLGFVVAVARRSGWPTAAVTRLAALVSTARALCQADRDAPATHVALAGLLDATRELAADDSLWRSTDERTRATWTRDRALLMVAEKARRARLERALSRLAHGD